MKIIQNKVLAVGANDINDMNWKNEFQLYGLLSINQ